MITKRIEELLENVLNQCFVGHVMPHFSKMSLSSSHIILAAWCFLN
jgi:hypothetical protein